MANMQRSRGIGGHILQHNALAASELTVAVARARSENVDQFGVEGAGGQAEVDKPGASDFGGSDLLCLGQRPDQLLGEFPRWTFNFLRQA